jgi:DNA recombination protein RmuC
MWACILLSIGKTFVKESVDLVLAPFIKFIVIAVVIAVALAVLITVLVARGKRIKLQKEADGTINDLNTKLQLSQAELSGLRISTEQQLKVKDELISQMAKNYEKNLDDIRTSHKETLKAQSEALKAELTAQTEKLLKQREEALSTKAKETFENITGNLGKDIAAMKTAFEENKTNQTKTSTDLKNQFESAVKQLTEQTRSVGEKADNLAEAMRGQKKYQGIWGETILRRLLEDEGMAEGRDFDCEETLRNARGTVIKNEETSRAMRPDFILHFADHQDIAVDSKVSLSAFSDYLEAKTDAERQDARQRNVEAIRNQVKNLSGKDYSSYLLPGNRMVDFVIMFVPSHDALQMAYEDDPKLWREAYNKHVLVTSSDTLLPFVRMIVLGWRNVEQVRNQQKIIDAATKMIDRVAEFSKLYNEVGEKLAKAQEAYDKGRSKFADKGHSILVSANQVRSLGVPSKKELPSPDDYAASIPVEEAETAE